MTAGTIKLEPGPIVHRDGTHFAIEALEGLARVLARRILDQRREILSISDLGASKQLMSSQALHRTCKRMTASLKAKAS